MIRHDIVWSYAVDIAEQFPVPGKPLIPTPDAAEVAGRVHDCDRSEGGGLTRLADGTLVTHEVMVVVLERDGDLCPVLYRGRVHNLTKDALHGPSFTLPNLAVGQILRVRFSECILRMNPGLLPIP